MRYEIGERHLAVRLRRDAQQGRGGGDGERGRHPGRDLRRDGRTGTLLAAAAGERVGTRFPAAPRARAPSFKLWLRYAKPARGTVVVDAGAARVLREQRLAACCRSGSPASRATSRPATRSRSSADGEAVGKGIVNYSAGELGRIKGMKSAEVQELMPHAAEEAVHRDHFVLT